MHNGVIIKALSGFYYVKTAVGILECKAKGIFRKNKLKPLVGDFVDVSILDEENKKELSRIASKLKVPYKECSMSDVDFTVFRNSKKV